jgi:hypothetical protein
MSWTFSEALGMTFVVHGSIVRYDRRRRQWRAFAFAKRATVPSRGEAHAERIFERTADPEARSHRLR